MDDMTAKETITKLVEEANRNIDLYIKLFEEVKTDNQARFESLRQILDENDEQKFDKVNALVKRLSVDLTNVVEDISENVTDLRELIEKYDIINQMRTNS